MAVLNREQVGSLEGYAVLDEDFGSMYFNLGNAKTASVHTVIDNADADGYMSIQVSNKPSLGWINVPWQDENGNYQTQYHVQAGVDVETIFNVPFVAAGNLRLYYDRTSGTGGLDFVVHFKR